MAWRSARGSSWRVQAETRSWPDWRDAQAYAPLLDADPSLVAWEWLRRSPDYQSAALIELSGAIPTGPGARPEHFGLVRFEPPELAVPFARPLWRSEVHPHVLAATPAPSGDDERFDLQRLGELASIAAGRASDHLLLSDGHHALRLDVPSGMFKGGPVRLSYSIDGLHGAEAPLLTLRRLLSLYRTGRFAPSLHPRQPRAHRWIAMLRAWDAIAAGADQRDVAREIFSRSVAEPNWRSREPSVRSRAQRLARCARQMAAGGYVALLA
jgi:hypothetical protein